MIKVVKHGHAPYRMTCRNCECVFTFEDSDIKNNGCQWDYCEYIYCPECRTQNDISSRDKYRSAASSFENEKSKNNYWTKN